MFQAANFSIRMPLPVASGDAGGDAGMQFGDFGAYPRKKDFYLLDFLIFPPIFSFFSPIFQHLSTASFQREDPWRVRSMIRTLSGSYILLAP